MGNERQAAVPPPAFEVVALGASAGGLTALKRVLGDLPGDFPVPVLLVQHLDPRHRSLMADILARHTDLEVREADEGDDLAPGTVYVAVPDHHLLVTDDHTIALPRTELVRFLRPSIDLLFESVAGTYGDRTIAVVLTGTGRDGAMGVGAVGERGGTVIAEDPATAEFSAMPQSAVDTGQVDFVLPLEDIGEAILRLVEQQGQ